MNRGIGNDIIEIERIASAIKRHGERFLHRIFTDEEQTYCNQFRHATRHYAGRFAAKEAVAKALGTGIGASLGWKDIMITNDASGKPIAQLSTQAADSHQHPDLLISLSHCQHYATAFAVAS